MNLFRILSCVSKIPFLLHLRALKTFKKSSFSITAENTKKKSYVFEIEQNVILKSTLPLKTEQNCQRFQRALQTFSF